MANASDFLRYKDPKTGKIVVVDKRTGGASSAIAKTSGNSEVNRLQAELANQRGQIKAAGQTPGKKTGILDRVLNIAARPFDIISRTSYASNEGLNRLVKGVKKGGFSIDDVGSAFAGYGSGLSGKSKTSFSSVLGSAGVTNPWVKGIGGFIGDVALDPLTYVGLGAVKARKAVDIASEASEVAAKAATKGSATWKAAEVAERAEHVAAAKAGKVTLTGKPLAKARRSRFQEIAADLAWQEANAHQLALEANNRGRLVLKAKVPFGNEIEIGGKSAAFNRVMEAAYSIGIKPAEIAKNTEVGAGLAKRFQPAATLIGKTHNISREAEMRGAANHREFAELVKNEVKGLSNEDKRLIVRYLEDPTLALTPAQQKTADWARKRLDDMYDIEAAHTGKYRSRTKVVKGAVVPNPDTDYVENYIQHWARSGSKKDIDAYKKWRKNELANGRPVPIAEAQARGLKPVDRIDQLLVNRAAEHERLMAIHSFRDGVLSQYGVQLKNVALAKKMGLEHINPKQTIGGVRDMYLPPDVKKAFDHMDGMFKNGTEDADQLMRHVDKVVSHWKFGVTAANPGHHIRNLMGDVYLNYLDGVMNPRRYKESAKLLNEGIRKNMTIQVGKMNVSGEDILALYRRSGAESGFIRSDFSQGGVNKPMEAIRNFAEKREDFGRMAHFLDVLKKDGKNVTNRFELDDVSKIASQRVRKWNLDYGDLTDFEKRYMKRVMPFYTWMRKNVPLQMEALATRPGKVLAQPKGMHAIEELLGTSEIDSEPFPQWIKEQSFARLGHLGTKGNPWIWSPSLPSGDVGKLFGGGEGLKGVFSNQVNSLSPLAKIPIELGTDRSLFTGAQRDSGTEYFGDQLFGPGKTIQALMPGKMGVADRINKLAGLGTREISEKQQLGELRRQQDPLQQQIRQINKDRLDKFMASLGVG